MGAYIRSTQDVQILDLVSEGEIEGLVDGLQSVYLNSIPVMSPTGSLNYKEVVVEHRYGTQSQSALSILNGVEAEFSLGAEVKYGTPVQATISDDNVSSARVTISMNGLYGEGKNGLAYKTLRYRIEVDDGSGVYKQASRVGYKTYDNISVVGNNTNSITVTTSSATADTQGLDLYFAWLTPSSTKSVTMNTESRSYNIWDGNSNVSTTTYKILDGTPPDYLLQYKKTSSSTWLTFSSGTLPELPTDGSLTDNAYAIHVNDSALPPDNYHFKFTLSGGTGVGFVGGAIDLATKVGTWNIIGKKRYKVVHRTGISSFYANTSLVTTGSTYLVGDISRYAGSGGDITLRLASQLPADLTYEIGLPGRVGPTRSIRVTKLDADVISKGSNSISFKGYTEVVDERLRYPNSAYFYVRADAEQFGGKIPSRAYELDLIKIKIPTNYNPHTRVNTGLWDGTFKVAWSNNPAWVFFDLATNPRYGLGEYITETQIDKWSLYTIAKYCDESVDSGFGIKEPRFTTNIYLQTREEAYTVLQNLASVFRGLTYWNAGQLVSIQDAPKNPVAIFSKANVIDGIFSYSGSSKKARHSVALVTWNDPEDIYKAKVEYVEDTESLQLYGVRQLEVVATGCTSRGQAHRLGRWMLYSEKLETEVVSFNFGLDNSGVVPGDIIQVLDTSRAGIRYSGRLVDVTTTSVTIDAPLDFLVGVPYTLMISLPKGAETILPDGSTTTSSLSELVEIPFTVSTNTNSVVITPGGTIFSTLPLVNSVWGISEESVVPQEFKVISVVQLDSSTFELSALEHNNEKFAAVEEGLDLPISSISILEATPSKVEAHQTTESLAISIDGTLRTDIELGWDKVDTANTYTVEYMYTYTDEDIGVVESAWLEAHNRVPTQSVTIPDVLEGGNYYFRIYSANDIGGTSLPYETTEPYLVQGKTAAPEDVQNFTAEKVDGGVKLSWDHVSDLDLSGYIIKKGIEWETAETLTILHTSNTLIHDNIGKGDNFYLIRAIDTTGNISELVTSTYITLELPGSVYQFIAVQNKSAIQLDWSPSTNTAYYELREGLSWEASVKITTTASTQISIPSGLGGRDRYFLIKGISLVGLYSYLSSATTTHIAEIPDRNILYTIDKELDSYAGNHLNTTGSTSLQIANIAEQPYGEFTFDVDLGYNIAAQSTPLFTVGVAQAGILPWTDANFSWDSASAKTRAWLPNGDVSIDTVQVAVLLSIDNEELTTNYVDTIRLDGSSASYTGIPLATGSSNAATFVTSGRVGDGLEVFGSTTAAWDISLPDQFSVFVWVNPSEDFDTTGFIYNLFSVYNTATQASILVRYSAGGVELVDQDEIVQRIELNMQQGSLYSVAISQDILNRTIMGSSMLGSLGAVSNSINLEPSDTFDKIRLY